MNRSILRLCALVGVLTLAACGKKGPTNPGGSTASIAVSTTAATLSVAQAATGSAPITVARSTYSGDVALTAEGLPAGITATFTPATLSGTATASTLELQVSGTAAVGTTTITVRARGTGVADATTPIAITVTTAGAGAGVSLAASPVNADILPGEGASTTVTFTRTGGFTGGVTFTVTGAPTGMTTTFSSANPVTAATGTLSISTTTAVTPGTYTLVLRANSAGITEATTTWTVVIGPLPVNAFTWRFCDTSRIPVFFAYQNGASGPWRKANDVSAGVFSFNVDQPQIGIATVSNDGSTVVTSVRYVGLGEVAAAAAAECTEHPAAGTKSHTGTVSGIAAATEVVTASLGGSVSSAATLGNPNFSMTGVQSGPRDLIAVLSNLSTSTASRLFLRRGVDQASGTSLGTLDMFGANSFVPATSQLTVTAPNDGSILAQTEFTTATGSGATITTPQLSSGVAATYQGVPEASMVTSDVQLVRVTQNVSASLSRFLVRYIRGPAAVSVSMPSDPGAPTVAAISGATYPRATISGSLPAAFNGPLTFTLQQSSRSRLVEISATPAGRTGTTDYSLSIPDLSGVTGWQSTWALGSGATVVTSTLVGRTNTAADGTPITGSTIFTVVRSGSFTFP